MKKLNRFKSDSFLTAGAVFLSRLGTLPANISPLGSFGFFHSSPWLYLASIVLFDFLVGGFYQGFLWTYLGFLAYPALGLVARRYRLGKQAMLLPVASTAFFLLSNFGVWLYWYPATWSGLLTCYTLALPFFWRTLVGDLLFGYAYLSIKARLPQKIWQYVDRWTIHRQTALASR